PVHLRSRSFRHDDHFFQPALTQKTYMHGNANGFFAEEFKETVDGFNRLSIELNNDVSVLYAAVIERIYFHHFKNINAGSIRDSVVLTHSFRKTNGLSGNSNDGAVHFSFHDQLSGNITGKVRRYCKANALRRRNDSRIHTNHCTFRIQKWSSRVAWIQCSICLYYIIDQSSIARPQASSNCTHYTCRNGLLQSIWIADGYCYLSGLHMIGIGERKCTTTMSDYLEERNVG